MQNGIVSADFENQQPPMNCGPIKSFGYTNSRGARFLDIEFHLESSSLQFSLDNNGYLKFANAPL